MVVGLVLVLATVFGGVDQYLGSFSAHPWMADVSLLSAPWLAIAFLAGWTQKSPRRAAALGFACTVVALVGYAIMTLSPVENAHLTVRTLSGFLYSERPVLLGGAFTGPLFGWFGYKWREQRAILGAIAVALAICLEPLARVPADRQIHTTNVAYAEVAVGMLTLAYIAVSVRRRQTPNRA